MRIERAISIQQPWVEQILRGLKRREFRDVPTNIRERVYLYASRTPAKSAAAWRKVDAEPGGLQTGVIVGSVEIVGCRFNDRRDCYEYVLAKPKRLKRQRVAVNRPNPIWWRPRFR